jgi:hypothetical protein
MTESILLEYATQLAADAMVDEAKRHTFREWKIYKGTKNGEEYFSDDPNDLSECSEINFSEKAQNIFNSWYDYFYDYLKNFTERIIDVSVDTIYEDKENLEKCKIKLRESFEPHNNKQTYLLVHTNKYGINIIPFKSEKDHTGFYNGDNNNLSDIQNIVDKLELDVDFSDVEESIEIFKPEKPINID